MVAKTVRMGLSQRMVGVRKEKWYRKEGRKNGTGRKGERVQE